MYKKTLIGMTMMAMLLFTGAIAQAQGGYGYMMGPGGNGYYQPSPEQMQAYQDIYQKYGQQLADIQQKMWSNRAQLNGVLSQDPLDEKKIDALTADMGKLMSRSYKLQAEISKAMRDKGLPYYGMGPGMMGGYGMGPGMMGGYGMGPGMMGPGYYGRGGYGGGPNRGYGPNGMGPGMMQ